MRVCFGVKTECCVMQQVAVSILGHRARRTLQVKEVRLVSDEVLVVAILRQGCGIDNPIGMIADFVCGYAVLISYVVVVPDVSRQLAAVGCAEGVGAI